jgi:hypothetical protein
LGMGKQSQAGLGVGWLVGFDLWAGEKGRQRERMRVRQTDDSHVSLIMLVSHWFCCAADWVKSAFR